MIESRHIENILLTEQYRPKYLYSEVVEQNGKLKKVQPEFEIILPNRVKEKFVEGIRGNYLFNGSFGCGKTSLARMLVKQFEHPFIEVNASINPMDILRDEIEPFCVYNSMSSVKKSNCKVVILDELDGASSQFFDAFRNFIEKYKHVRFIATCNDISKIPEGLRTRRFTRIDFAFTEEDEKEMKSAYAYKLFYIAKNNDMTIDKPALSTLVKKYYPDMGSMINVIQDVLNADKKVVEMIDVQSTHTIFKSLFELIFNSTDTVENYKTISREYVSKVTASLLSLYKEFPKYIIEEKPDYINLIPDFMIELEGYQSRRHLQSDVTLTLYALVSKYQQLIQYYNVKNKLNNRQ